MTRLSFLAAFVVLGLVWAGMAAAQGPIQTFTVKEVFGVAHPNQIIDFDLAEPVDPNNAYLLGPEGQEVAYQLLEGGKKIAVQTDLPANAEKTWRLETGRRPQAAAGGISVQEKEGYYEITNGLIGIRVPPAQEGGAQTPAPIQGIQYRDGQWTATGPNYLSLPAKTMNVTFVEKGPLKVVVRVSYTFEAPAAGTYVCTTEVQAGQPSVLFEEDADNVEVSYEFDPRPGLDPDRVRYRCHHSEPYHGPGPEEEAPLTGNRTLRLAVWDPWIHDGGWQIAAFNAGAPPTANLFGLFQGRTSRALGAGNSGMRLISRDGQVVVRMQLARQNYTGGSYTHNRFSWGMYLGMRGDVRPPLEIQPIDLQRNLHAGINLNKLHRLVLDFPEPPGRYGSMYMSREALDRLIRKVRTDDAYYQHLREAEPSFRPMLEFWRDTTGQQVHAAAQDVLDKARETLDILMNQHGIMDKRVHYYEGVFNIVNYFYKADQVLASDLATEEDRAKVKQAVVLFGSIWTDDDHTPAQPDTGLNYGTPNMPLTFASFRDMFTIYLAGHPAFRPRVAEVVARTENILKAQINEHGSHMGGMHYIEASFSVTVSNMLLLKQAGLADFFKTDAERDYRLTKFAEFMMNAMTPPEPRFGNLRKFIATGDASTESADRYGLLATGFAECNPELSKRLMGAWRQNGSHHSSMFGSSVLKIDDDLSDQDPALGSANFPGYYSVLREGWGTRNETAVWFINGDWYRDHKHEGDGGEVVIYALGAPLSLDFGSMYSPRSPGPEYHSVVRPGGWKPRLEAFEVVPGGGFSRATFELPGNVTWTRAVSLVMLGADLPVIAVQDFFNGAGEKTWQLNLMAEGPIETPEGPRLPGQTFAVPAGVTRLAVTGQTWPAHATQGIDWDLYLVTAKPQQAEIGEWKHNWHPSTEQGQFQRANGRAFEERQYLLRVKGDGPFRAILVPYFKGQKPADFAASVVGDGLVAASGGRSVRFASDGRIVR